MRVTAHPAILCAFALNLGPAPPRPPSGFASVADITEVSEDDLRNDVGLKPFHAKKIMKEATGGAAAEEAEEGGRATWSLQRKSGEDQAGRAQEARG